MNAQLRGLNRATWGVDGDWYHIMPMGEFRNMSGLKPGGKQIRFTEIVDREAIERVMAAYRERAADPEWPGYLVGKEHYSQENAGTTEAYAWAKELEIRDDAGVPVRARGIWAKFVKTPLGEQAIGSVYKFCSCVNPLEHIDGDRYRPVAIDDIGLTNKPAHKTLVPAMHRDRNMEEGNMLEKLRALLAKHRVSLAADADEDAALGAVDTALTGTATKVSELTERAATAEHRVTELEEADLERRADAFVAQHKDRFGDPEKLKARFKADPAGTEELVGGLKPAEAKDAQRVLHRAGGKTPDGDPGSVDTAAAKRVEREAFLDEVKARHKVSTRAAAWEIAAVEKPELFA